MFKLRLNYRRQMEWHVFERKQSGSWFLSLLPTYARLFERLETGIMKKASSDWKESASGKAMNLLLRNLTADEVDRVKRFIADFERHVILGPSRHLEPYFSKEIDFCLALDFNFSSVEEGRHTDIGKLEYLAKYQGSISAADKIAEQMASAFERIPTSTKLSDRCLTYVPPSPDRDYYLPRYLARKLVSYPSVAERLRTTRALVDAELRTRKPKIKETKFIQKVRKCANIYSIGNVRLSAPVEGSSVYVVDDLYKSGVSLWSFAKCLKDLGAAEVICLICVKACGDKDSS